MLIAQMFTCIGQVYNKVNRNIHLELLFLKLHNDFP